MILYFVLGLFLSAVLTYFTYEDDKKVGEKQKSTTYLVFFVLFALVWPIMPVLYIINLFAEWFNLE